MTDKNIISSEFLLAPFDNRRFANLCGNFDENIKQIEEYFKVDILSKGDILKICGSDESVGKTRAIINKLYKMSASEEINFEAIHVLLRENEMNKNDDFKDSDKIQNEFNQIQTSKKLIRPRGENQSDYLSNIMLNDLTFGIGPAGTGKTYLAVASAIKALENDDVRRIILVRPAVEAGERLGFLPGDMSQKVDPFLRPMYDALYDMLGANQVSKLIDQHLIEIAPLAFMRGRSLNESFLILDEAQNTTIEQMKMFLTRIGFGSRAVVTGDITQIDLPKGQRSGLKHCAKILSKIKKIAFTYFTAEDVVRHDLVKLIIEAYESS
jgi:phosphate starvation-inducible PhoH-like protein